MREPRNYEAPLCAQVDAELWFPESGGGYTGVLRAKRICGSCIHKYECAEWGINNERHGLWGGLTVEERKSIRRSRNITLPKEKSA